jgi:hypothetical protein
MHNQTTFVPVAKKTIVCSLAFLLVSNVAFSTSCLAAVGDSGSPAVSIPSPTKTGNLQLGGYARLGTGAGPTTNDISGASTTTDSASTTDSVGTATQAPAAPSNNVDLQPLKLGSEEPTSTTVDAATVDGGVLKTEVSKEGFVPKEDSPAVVSDQSVVPGNNNAKGKGHKKGKNAKDIVQQAKDVAVGPVPLLVSDKEEEKAVDLMDSAEKQQLADLWEAALKRSPDIQFVVAKLQPTTDQAHLSSILTRIVSTAAYAGMGSMAMVAPGIGTYAASSLGSSMLMQVAGMQQKKADKAAKLSDEEQLMMLWMVRQTADKLVVSYRGYKKNFVKLSRATTDLQDLQAMAADARAGQDAAKQLEMDYVLRKQQRDIDEIADDVRAHRASLNDLAGPESVAKLDKQIIWEQTQVEQGSNGGGPIDVNASTATPKSTDTKAHGGGADKTQTASNPSPQS